MCSSDLCPCALPISCYELKRIPFLLIVGEKEQQEGQVSVRVQGEGDKGSMSQQEFAALVTESVKKEVEALNK